MEEKKTIRTRRVGTVTFGLLLTFAMVMAGMDWMFAHTPVQGFYF